MKALKIPADNTQAMFIMDIKTDKFTPLYQPLAKVLGCTYIEPVTIGNWKTRDRFDTMKLIVDDAGALKSLPRNERASVLYGYPVHGASIYGDALVVGQGYFEDGPDICGLEKVSHDFDINDLGEWRTLFRELMV